MTAKIIDGKQIANETILEIKETISKATMKGEKPPGLAVIQVGEDSASKIYIKNKRIACSKVGIKSFNYDLPEQTSETELIELVGSKSLASFFYFGMEFFNEKLLCFQESKFLINNWKISLSY